MALSTKEIFIGTAHLLVGPGQAFSADGTGLVNLGEQRTISIGTGDGEIAYAATPSGHRNASNAIDYGRVPMLDVVADEVTREALGILVSGTIVDADGNLGFQTGAAAAQTLSAVVVPSSNVDASGAVIDLQKVFWLPFLVGSGSPTFTFNNERGDNANTAVSTQLVGLVGSTYDGAPLPTIARTLYYGDPAAAGLTWKLPAPYQPAV